MKHSWALKTDKTYGKGCKRNECPLGKLFVLMLYKITRNSIPPKSDEEISSRCGNFSSRCQKEEKTFTTCNCYIVTRGQFNKVWYSAVKCDVCDWLEVGKGWKLEDWKAPENMFMWIGDPLHIVSCLMGSFPHPIICWQLDDEEIEEVS